MHLLQVGRYGKHGPDFKTLINHHKKSNFEMHVAMVVYNMAEGNYLFENLNRPSSVGLTQP